MDDIIFNDNIRVSRDLKEKLLIEDNNLLETPDGKRKNELPNVYRPKMMRYIRYMSDEYSQMSNPNFSYPDYSYPLQKLNDFPNLQNPRNNNSNNQPISQIPKKDENFKRYDSLKNGSYQGNNNSQTNSNIEIISTDMNANSHIEKIRRIQKKKIPTDPYPFPAFNDESKTETRKTEKKPKNERIGNQNLQRKNIVAEHFRPHFVVQLFSIIFIGLFITAISCAAYYAQKWKPIINLLPDFISLSKINVLSSFIFSDGKIELSSNLIGSDKVFSQEFNEVNYGQIYIQNSTVFCDSIMASDDITFGAIDYILEEDGVHVMPLPYYPSATFTSSISDIGTLDLRNVDVIIDGTTIQKIINQGNLPSSAKILSTKNQRKQKNCEKIKRFGKNLRKIESIKFDSPKSTPRTSIENKESLHFMKDGILFIKIQNGKVKDVAENVKLADVKMDSKGRPIFLFFDESGFNIGACVDRDCEQTRIVQMKKLNVPVVKNLQLELNKIGLPIITINQKIEIKCTHRLCVNDAYL
ncbi:hypothetical protein TRFO_05607 [Tritrichomonas foetus]|uniref:Uncharacterized protein n=1 Tax=Tritrichomonas foetus TaxID=1144522 RepID=A0A1J4K5C8_9EUKA|nr:hypothetical protein TRFO_05607 [Tritrichomonas foetus]|eukprot:OHT06403.1 hypothetical protein TRFO_05607 [Tritrichomonas foetus]